MPKLIRINEENREVTHDECGAVISYYDRELIKGAHHDYGGGSEVWYYIWCPNPLCEKKVEIK